MKRRKTRKSPKFERCVRSVKKSRSAANPWAVCHASMKRTKRDPSQFGRTTSWTVSLHGKIIDRVFFTQDMTAEEVRQALIRHDGYDPKIKVRRKVTRRDPRGALVNRPHHARRSMDKKVSNVVHPNDQRQYEEHEVRSFLSDLARVEKAPLADRKEGARNFADAMATDPEIVAERVGWLLDGSYGYGSYVAREVARSPRMNRVAWLTQTVGSLEWNSPWAMTRAAWKKMTPAQQRKLNGEVTLAIVNHLKEEG